ncbi:DMT family transporter [Dyella flagellata]|uniref:Membrane protein n=1 Tax=Dyella flagellata TaxID=1867833 RepID=A0ABQ5X786_9GAMM|nr:EamA family transporter [Dyella flagellata]GLQ87487.1 membrane protein [Dyella flagellata]
MPAAKTSPDFAAYLLLFGVGIIWGGQFLFNAQAINYFSPVTIAASRVLIGALTLTVIAWLVPEKAKSSAQRPATTWLLLIAVALFEAVLPLFLIAWGQQHVASSVTAVIVGSVPIVTLILSVLLGSQKSRFSAASGASVALGFVGIIVLVRPDAGGISLQSLIYQLAIFAGVVSFGMSLTLFEKLPQGTPIRSARNVLSLASVPLVIAACLEDKPWLLTWNWHTLMPILVLGVVSSGIAYYMYGLLIQRSGPVFTSISNFIVPVVGVLLGVLVRDEPFGKKEWLALALIVGALIVNELKAFSKPRWNAGKAPQSEKTG